MQIRFDDPVAYERMMGGWSRLAGNIFLDWLQPPTSLRWIDIGCGNGAFTELLLYRCAPVEVFGIDPSSSQLDFARQRTTAKGARFALGDAMALPCEDGRFDAAVMALVIFFVPDPVKAVGEMVRAVRPGGSISAYAWDVVGQGSPIDPLRAQLVELGIVPPSAPSGYASRSEALVELWRGAGLEDVQTTTITVQRRFVDFEDFWHTTVNGSILQPAIVRLGLSDLERLKSLTRSAMPVDRSGSLTYEARANAVKGRVPR